jgi:hypothetical protein
MYNVSLKFENFKIGIYLFIKYNKIHFYYKKIPTLNSILLVLLQTLI